MMHIHQGKTCGMRVQTFSSNLDTPPYLANVSHAAEDEEDAGNNTPMDQTFSLSTHLSPVSTQTHRTVVTNPEWSTCFGTGLRTLGVKIAF
jgi:hypothetical protein